MQDLIILPQNENAGLVWHPGWLVILLAACSVFILVLWLKARKRYEAHAKQRPISFKKFCSENDISNRETEVLDLLLAGKSNAEIQETLFISKNTVRNHVHNIYQKLGIKNRVELVNRVHGTVLADQNE